MAQNLPENTANIENRLRVDVQREAPDSQPFVDAHFLGSMLKAYARRIFDFYEDLRLETIRRMPHTADEENAKIWGNIYGVNRNGETQANGNIVITGVAGSTLPAGSTVSFGENTYQTQADINITAKTLSVVSVDVSGTTATVITSDPHNLSSFVPVTMLGADDAGFNLADVDITVIDNDAFTYQVDAGLPATATGTITATFASGFGNVVSDQFGSSVNLNADSTVQLQSPTVGVDDSAYVDFGAIGGGSDIETLAQHKARYLEKMRNPISQYNVAAVVAQAKKVAGVTRVFVQQSGTITGTFDIATLELLANGIAKATTTTPHGLDDGQEITITGASQSSYNVTNATVLTEEDDVFHFSIIGSPVSPATGTISGFGIIPLGTSVTYFMRDNDATPIPTASEVATVKAKIDEIVPVNTALYNNIVRAPQPVYINYQITSLVPDSTSMREAIRANLEQFHTEFETIGATIDEDRYRAAIASSVDLNNGDIVKTFELTTPVGDVAIGTGQIAQLGSVDFV